ncbi:MAG: acyl carrier protein [Myxococcota bacterium]
MSDPTNAPMRASSSASKNESNAGSAGETWTELARLLRERFAHAGDVTPETDLVGELGLDSIQQLELLVELENHFEIALEPEGDETIQTAGDLVAWVDRARRGAER